MFTRTLKISLLATLGLLTACSQNETQNAATEAKQAVAKAEKVAEQVIAEAVTSAPDLDQILAAQDQKAQDRYQYRHPKETLEFFEVEPGMKVIEALPGGGWYSKILLPLLGEEGELVGVDYAVKMWPLFGGFATEEFVEKKKTWVETWTADASAWRTDGSAAVSAFQYGSMPESLAGTADAALFIRALHNLARFQEQGAYLDTAIKETFTALKPGGIVGVVQHTAREDRPDAWADGSNGYVKKSAMIAKFTEHGFELVDENDINSNAKDLAGEGDFVWRLPPSLNGSKDDPEKRAAMVAIGESNRMTLKFRKPS